MTESTVCARRTRGCTNQSFFLTPVDVPRLHDLVAEDGMVPVVGLSSLLSFRNSRPYHDSSTETGCKVTQSDGEVGQKELRESIHCKVGMTYPPPEPSYEPLTKHCRSEVPGQCSRAVKKGKSMPPNSNKHPPNGNGVIPSIQQNCNSTALPFRNPTQKRCTRLTH